MNSGSFLYFCMAAGPPVCISTIALITLVFCSAFMMSGCPKAFSTPGGSAILVLLSALTISLLPASLPPPKLIFLFSNVMAWLFELCSILMNCSAFAGIPVPIICDLTLKTVFMKSGKRPFAVSMAARMTELKLSSAASCHPFTCITRGGARRYGGSGGRCMRLLV